jgi:hypothetical protein
MKAYIKNLRRGERERIAYCPKCDSECSANKADYFFAPEDYPLKCCNRIMDIVVKKTIFEEVE